MRPVPVQGGVPARERATWPEREIPEPAGRLRSAIIRPPACLVCDSFANRLWRRDRDRNTLSRLLPKDANGHEPPHILPQFQPQDRPRPPAGRRPEAGRLPQRQRPGGNRPHRPCVRRVGIPGPGMPGPGGDAGIPAGADQGRAGEKGPRGRAAVRPPQHPLCHGFQQHAGLDHPQPLQGLFRHRRRLHHPVGIPQRRTPVRIPAPGQGTAHRRGVLLFRFRGKRGCARGRLRRGPRRHPPGACRG